MPEWIDHAQRALEAATGKRIFEVTPLRYGLRGVEPHRKRRRQERLGRLLGQRLLSLRFEGLPGRVHIHDSMLMNGLPGEIERYAGIGRSAMANIEAALGQAGRGWGDLDRCLDMACGYGRVLRWLVGKLPADRILACEVEAPALRFLRAEFGVATQLATHTPETMRWPGPFDLVWVGSLFTHLPPAQGIATMRRLGEHLAPGGLLVFSTQGRSCLRHIPFYGFMFEDAAGDFAAQLDAGGAAYRPYYETEPGYGITLFDEKFLKSELEAGGTPRLHCVMFRERGWDDHQDVWAFTV